MAVQNGETQRNQHHATRPQFGLVRGRSRCVRETCTASLRFRHARHRCRNHATKMLRVLAAFVLIQVNHLRITGQQWIRLDTCMHHEARHCRIRGFPADPDRVVIARTRTGIDALALAYAQDSSR